MQVQRNTIAKLLSLQAGEEETVWLFVAYSLLMGAAGAVFFTATTSLFLINFDRTQMPLAFMASGSLVYILGQAVKGLRQRASFVRVNGYLLVFLLLSIGGLVLVGSSGANKWLYFMLFLWNRVFVFVNGITFWATAGRIFKLSQSKRLFSFISTGEVVASIFSYFSVPLLLKVMSTHDLLFICLFFLLLCVGLMAFIYRKFGERLALSPLAAVSPETVPALADDSVNRKPYYRLLALLAFMPVFGLIYVEYLFTVLSKEIFPNKEVLASFLGIFFGICAVIELLIKSFLYNQLISTYSIRTGIILLPLGLAGSFALGSIYGTFYGTTSLFFALMAVSRFLMSSVRKAISEPAFQVLFQPIPLAERTSLQSYIESVPKALGSLLPGLLLLLLTNVGFIDLVELSYLFLAIAVGWSVLAFRVQAGYRDMLQLAVLRSIRSADSADEASPETEPTEARPTTATAFTFQEIETLVSSDQTEGRIRAAEALGRSDRYHAYKHLLTLLQDAEPSVRRVALEAAGQSGRSELWPSLLEHLRMPAYQEVAGSALCAIGEPVVPTLIRFFNQSQKVGELQIRVAGIIGEIGGETSLRFLRTTLNHPILAVRHQVFNGLKRLRHRATVTERSHVLEQIDEQIALLVWVAAARLDLNALGESSPIARALCEEEKRVIPNLFNRLAVLYGDDRFDLISELLTHQVDDIREYVIELLTTTVPDEVKSDLLPLFTDMPLLEQVRRCSVNYPQQQLSVGQRLRDIINKDFNAISSQLKAVALLELPENDSADPTTLLVAHTIAPDEGVAETALYVLKQVNPARFAELVRQMQTDSERAAISRRVADGLEPEQLRLWPFIQSWYADKQPSYVH
ncbi:HEAT repeat protein [Larkinella arboricola]|uniref:HEAT repeat protein n=1 Tax=Larkinella arboricola TaxID=643671 RepID=A0A327WNI9_LARAB|nr:HEAT repeat domain-containing protein [Larkinella arboricola]RAJ93165.1 HEAT repeat protein [Larkinella arboricola]